MVATDGHALYNVLSAWPIIGRGARHFTVQDVKLAMAVSGGGFTRAAIDVILNTQFGTRGFGGRHASTMSPRQLKEVIQVAHTNVGSVASLGALVGGEVHR